MEYQSAMQMKKNSMATTSMVSGIVAWVLAILLLCFNFVIVPLFAIATLGLGTILYVCTGCLGCISPIGWLVAVITGHVAKNQIKQTGESGDGQATAGLIMGYIGLALVLIGICVSVILSALGVITIPLMETYQ